MPETIPNFPIGLKLGDTNKLDTAAGSGSAMTLTPTVPGHRGEIQVIPNDGPDGNTRDPWAGGEVTILMRDTQFYGYTNSSAFTMRGTRDGSGNGVAWTLRGIKNGTDALYPLEIDTMDGTIQCRYNTNGTTWFLRGVQIGGTLANPNTPGYDDLPSLRIGPQPQPAIDLDGSGTGGKNFRLRSIGGDFSIVDVAAATQRFRINADGSAWFGRSVQMQGGESVPILLLGPQSQPAIDFQDTDANRTWRIRNLTGNISFADLTVGVERFKIDDTGSPYFNNLATIAPATAAPNLYADPSTGKISRITVPSKPTLPAALPTDGSASNAAIATLVNAMRSALIGYGIAQ